MGVSQNQGCPNPIIRTLVFLGSILGSHYFGKLLHPNNEPVIHAQAEEERAASAEARLRQAQRDRTWSRTAWGGLRSTPYYIIVVSIILY